jgi:hypothetical protein
MGSDPDGVTQEIRLTGAGPVNVGASITGRGGPMGDDVRALYDEKGKDSQRRSSVELHVPQGDPFALMFQLAPPPAMP